MHTGGIAKTKLVKPNSITKITCQKKILRTDNNFPRENFRFEDFSKFLASEKCQNHPQRGLQRTTEVLVVRPASSHAVNSIDTVDLECLLQHVVHDRHK